MAYGISATDAGLPLGLAQAMSAIVFGGASQFVGVRLIANGTPGALIVLTTLLVNSRHALYSASLAPYTEQLNRRWRWLLAYLLTDEAYATTVVRYRRGDASTFRHWFFLGSALALWTCWQATTAGGVFVGQAVPASWSLDFALPLTFLAILTRATRDKRAVAAAMVAGAVATIGFRWSYSTGLLTAMLAGMGAGMVASRGIDDSEALDDVEPVGLP